MVASSRVDRMVLLDCVRMTLTEVFTLWRPVCVKYSLVDPMPGCIPPRVVANLVHVLETSVASGAWTIFFYTMWLGGEKKVD